MKAMLSCLLLTLLASCLPASIPPNAATFPGSAPVSGASAAPNSQRISGSQRGQYVWEKMMEGVRMGALAGPYGAGAGLVLGGVIGLFTADAHYAKVDAQIQREQTKDKELEAQLEQELQRQKSLEEQVAAPGSVPVKPEPSAAEISAGSDRKSPEAVGSQRIEAIGPQASLGKDGPSDLRRSGFKNVAIKDMNHDGVPDLWIYYDPAKPGEIIRKEEDTSGDGQVDAWSTFSGSKLVRREVARSGGGRPDVVYLYENEIIAVEERDDQGKGLWTFRAHYRNGRVIKIEKDTDADGKMDLRIYYDPERDGEIVLKEEKDLDGDGSPDLWSFFESGRLVRRDVTAVGLEFLSGPESGPHPAGLFSSDVPKG